MSRPIIEVQHLAKKYRLGVVGATTLREDLARMTNRMRGREPEAEKGEFWALRDVSFSVQPGEVVGIIGRNGAGKSTLLKLLSRITEPTSGRAIMRGRVASLLEVGTGFHPELTGRDNVYLNGAILGMKRAEIRAKFDEIVAFAEVEKFIDTPVKHYSSGMYVRLAFAVAAHLESEILIIDEVLAVGDATFQRKCLGKLDNLSSGSGRTVLLVSHQIPAIQRLCRRVLWLDSGRLAMDGNTNDTINGYSKGGFCVSKRIDLRQIPASQRRGNGVARFTEFTIRDGSGIEKSEFRLGEEMQVELTIESERAISNVTFGFSFVSTDGTEIQGTSFHDSSPDSHLVVGSQRFCCHVAPLALVPGRYSIRAAIFRPNEIFDHLDQTLSFDVVAYAVEKSGPRDHHVGYVYSRYEWNRT